MFATKSLAFFFILSLGDAMSSARAECQEVWGGSYINRTAEFSLLSKKNLTGHWITSFSLDNAAQRLPKNWKANIKHSIQRDGVMEIFHLQGSLIVPPALPADYQLFPGVGYYKYHKEQFLDYDSAYVECAKEGGHLAIINSEAELNVIRSFVKKHQAYLGINDREKEGEFVTIFGEPLHSTGFQGWGETQPNNHGGRENCGTYYPDVGVNDAECDLKMNFVCEYDLSWTE